MLYAGPGSQRGMRRKTELISGWTHVHHELRRPRRHPGMLLWEEYQQAAPDGYGYKPLVRALPRLGGPAVADDAAIPPRRRTHVRRLCRRQTVELYDARTGEIRAAQIFVAVMGASSYTYAEASWTTDAAGLDRLARAGARLHGRRASAAGARQPTRSASPAPTGTSRGSTGPISTWQPITAPRSSRHDRGARVTRPRSRSVCWWSNDGFTGTVFRNRRFFSLSELNQETIGELVTDLNARPMRRLGVSRRDLFLELDRPALKPLPAEPYEYAEWRVRRVAPDYQRRQRTGIITRCRIG